MFNKSQAKEMQKYLKQNKRKYHETKPMKAYKMADEFGKGYEAIEMQKAMKNGCDQNAHRSEQDHPGVDRIERGEKFSGHGLQWVDWPHTAEDHGSVEQGVDPGEVFEKMIAEHAYQ